MSNTIKKHKKHWFFNAGLAVLACVICIWVVKLATIDIDSTKAAVLKQAVKISPNSATAHFLIDPMMQMRTNVLAAPIIFRSP